MSRIYTASFDDVSVTTNGGSAQDLLLVQTSSSVPIRLHSLTIDQRTLTAWEAKPLRFYKITGSPTITGGTTLTPRPNDQGNTVAAASIVKSIHTTVFTGGTTTLIMTAQWMFLNGYFYLPTPEDRFDFSVSSYFVVQLPTPPSAATNTSLAVTFEEFGG